MLTKDHVQPYWCEDAKRYLKRCTTVELAWNSCTRPTWMRYALDELGLYEDHRQVYETICDWSPTKIIENIKMCNEIRQLVPYTAIEKRLQEM